MITNKSLIELRSKGSIIQKPCSESSFVERNAYKLCRTPLNLFDVEDLRFMIGQEIGLEYLIPIAIIELRNNLLAEGDFYEGDLLKNVLSIDKKYWSNNSKIKDDLLLIIKEAKSIIEEFDTTQNIKNKLFDALEYFNS